MLNAVYNATVFLGAKCGVIYRRFSIVRYVDLGLYNLNELYRFN